MVEPSDLVELRELVDSMLDLVDSMLDLVELRVLMEQKLELMLISG